MDIRVPETPTVFHAFNLHIYSSHENHGKNESNT